MIAVTTHKKSFVASARHQKHPRGECSGECTKYRIVPYVGPNGRLCAGCHSKRVPQKKRVLPVGKCAKCGKKKALSYNNGIGKICSLCHKERLQKGDCPKCPRKNVFLPYLDGESHICRPCYQEKRRLLRKEEHKVVAMEENQEPKPKRKRTVREGFCSKCGHFDKIPYKNRTCGSCYNKNREPEARAPKPAPKTETVLPPKCDNPGHRKIKRAGGIIECITCRLMEKFGKQKQNQPSLN